MKFKIFIAMILRLKFTRGSLNRKLRLLFRKIKS